MISANQLRIIKSVLYAVLIVLCVIYLFSVRRPHIPEFAHYYIGAKYHRELGYFGIYDAYLKALMEIHNSDSLLTYIRAVRNLEDIGYMSPDKSLKRFANQRWRPERWREFVADVRFIDKKLAENPQKSVLQHWSTIMVDHGYNPPPTYTAYVLPLANLIGLNERNLTILCAFDIIFVAAIFTLIYLIAGLDAMVLSFVFFVSARDMLSYTTWSLFRFDWMFALALAFWMMKKEKFLISGIFWAISSLLRIFPAYMMFFAVIICLIIYRNNSKNLRKLGKFVLGLIIGAVGFVLLSAILLTLEGIDPLKAYIQFFARISVHSAESQLFNAIGLKKLFEHFNFNPGPLGELLIGLIFAVFLAVYLINLRANPYEIAVMSILFIPPFFYLSHYYYLMLVFLPTLKRRIINLFMGVFIAINIWITYSLHGASGYYRIVDKECVAYSIILLLMPISLWGIQFIHNKYRKTNSV